MSDATAYAQVQREELDSLLMEFLPLVKKIALYWSARLPPGIELDDLMQVGLIGLVQASENYDATQGASFATYASIRVKGAMLDEVRRNDWVPRSLQQKMKQVADAISRAEARLGRAPGDRDIADEMGIPLEEYQKVAGELTSCRLVSSSERDFEDSDRELNPASGTEKDGFRKALADEIQLLPEREQMVMSLYYGDELNLKEIGAILEVSESRVSQIHGQALARLRGRLCEWTD